LKAAGITDYIKPCHDLRHTALTNVSAAGTGSVALMAIAGHRSFSTTKKYVDLGGVVFQAEADALEPRVLGAKVLPNPVEDSPARERPTSRTSRAADQRPRTDDAGAAGVESSTRLSESQPISDDPAFAQTV
jgi:hypothetical protein